ncbi:MAG: hypothetical protein LUD02_08080 [Tannerellaceae bacterium]|nr:hypothetical protein [Tannerellaceae bacterium]
MIGLFIKDKKTNKKAEPLIPKKGRMIMDKYKHRSYQDYVFPVFLPKHTTEHLKYNRSEYITLRVNRTLEKVRKLIKCKDPIKWYTARGSYITALVNGGENMGVVAKQAGNTAAIITKHYYKNTEQTKSLHRLNKLFGSDVKAG